MKKSSQKILFICKMDISVVIITRNEANIIGNTLQSLNGLTNDIVIVDSGSTDDTLNVCKQYNATIIETDWKGYGLNKNMGINNASHNWILNLDADEAIDEELKQSILKLSLINENEVFEMWFKNFFMGKWIRHGEWGKDKHVRFFNRNKVKWNEGSVHEKLIFNKETIRTLLKGHIQHYTVHSLEEYEQKTIVYAKLSAQKFFNNGKKLSFIKQYLSPVFSFVQNYFYKLGFLDGKEGFLIARTTAKYTFLKYAFLGKLRKT